MFFFETFVLPKLKKWQTRLDVRVVSTIDVSREKCCFTVGIVAYYCKTRFLFVPLGFRT
jgi:hypothetical protein